MVSGSNAETAKGKMQGSLRFGFAFGRDDVKCGLWGGRHTPGLKPHVCWLRERAKAEALAYLEAKAIWHTLRKEGMAFLRWWSEVEQGYGDDDSGDEERGDELAVAAVAVGHV
ncbi:hypothetical protein GCM10011585_20820 [Edaphobacter dinghuensis]|uniref:Uncharacterized protein n=1 Tax=Edaphobacter dinghuensis TaxID=1560005 RepID=A0A917M4X1_9BACT|nr:hypothetical protein GCM10011585_20820 [Edaphobacter dinghuensis]